MRINEIITETTSSGGIATVVGGTGSMLYRNPSIYSNVGKYVKPAKKKKKKADQNKENK